MERLLVWRKSVYCFKFSRKIDIGLACFVWRDATIKKAISNALAFKQDVNVMFFYAFN